jgi:outer membrane protein assembly factor BamA
MSALHAQPDSRSAQIQAEQDAKSASLKPETQSKTEQVMLRFKDDRILERFTDGIAGFRVKLGGLVSGSGFAAGPEYKRTDLADGKLALRTSAEWSTKGFSKYDFEAGLPRFGGDRFFAVFYAVRHDYISLSYYGPGPNSEKSGRTDYRLEDVAVDGNFGARLAPHLIAGVSAGYLFNNIGPGQDSRYASAEQVYSPAQAPGIDHQANFVRTGAFAQYDWRDSPGGPRNGGNYFIQFSDYRDQTLGLHDFQRLDLEAQQYVPLLNERRVFALRAKSTLTFHDNGQVIPFYMQPTLGGGEDLRGYRPFRFRGDNLFVASAEYRWEVFSGLDMALFADAGKVFAPRSDFNLDHLESDVGFGFRFNVRNQTFLRIDTGFSHEGFQVRIRFNKVFNRGPVRTSSSMGDF